MNRPVLKTMASGNLSLTITEDITWETFPDQAADFVRKFNGIVLWRIDNGADRIWIVLIKCRPFFLAFDDLPWGMTLDSMSRFCTPVLHKIHAELLAEAKSQTPL